MIEVSDFKKLPVGTKMNLLGDGDAIWVLIENNEIRGLARLDTSHGGTKKPWGLEPTTIVHPKHITKIIE